MAKSEVSRVNGPPKSRSKNKKKTEKSSSSLKKRENSLSRFSEQFSKTEKIPLLSKTHEPIYE